MTKCIVKWYNDGKGYGFVSVIGDTSNRDVFCHYTSIHSEGYKTLTEGETVDCEILEGPKGPQTSKVIRNLCAVPVEALDTDQ